VDYITTERKFLESVLDAELNYFDDRAVFYSDDGTSFRNIMFLGNEATLLMFDILVFCTVDFYANDFVTATILTFLLSWALQNLRAYLGKRNLVRKTLVDERFLI